MWVWVRRAGRDGRDGAREPHTACREVVECLQPGVDGVLAPGLHETAPMVWAVVGAYYGRERPHIAGLATAAFSLTCGCRCKV